MWKLAVVGMFAVAGPVLAESPMRIVGMGVEHDRNTLGIGAAQPRLSWQLGSARENERQTAYELRAALADDDSPTAPLWTSGKIMSEQSAWVGWGWGGARALRSRERVVWQVRAWDGQGEPTAWSAPAAFEVGVLPGDGSWNAQWITTGAGRVEVAAPSLLAAQWIRPEGEVAAEGTVEAFRRTVKVEGPVLSAVANISTEGAFTLYVNGKVARNIPRRPNGWKTPTRCDMAVHFHPGENTLALLVGPPGQGGHPGVIGNVHIDGANGTVDQVTDGAWKGSVQPAVAAATRAATASRPAAPRVPEWAAETFDGSAWPAAAVIGPYGVEPWGKFEEDQRSGPGRYLRKGFEVKAGVARARLYATALGVYQATLNGRRVSPDELAPGFTDYHKRVLVQTYDVTGLLKEGGPNVLGVVLADGWYAGRLGWMGAAQYGTRPAFAGQLEVTYADGAREVVASDGSWQGAPPEAGELVASDQQWGDVLDHRRAMAGWDTSAFDASTWTAALVEEHALTLQPQVGPPVRRLAELKPVSIRRHNAGWIVDFGQNLVGVMRLTASGPAGTTLRVRHAERLTDAGDLYTANLRPARATDTFILAGTGEPETFSPPFTFHGFQYAEISGYPGTLTAEQVRAVVIGSELPSTASFDSSDPMLNRLYQNIVWGQRGNFLSVPTDCPQRDERLGWTGDAQVFAPTAARLADVSGFFEKWLIDLRDGQTPRGDFPNVAPRIGNNGPGAPAWGDAGTIVPWAMYQATGDTRFLADNYDAMKSWVEYLRKETKDDLRPRTGIGDWLSPGATAPLDLVANAYYARSIWILTKSALVLQRREDAVAYAALFNRVRAAFQKAYVSEGGGVTSDTQTAYLLALQFELLDEPLRTKASAKLAARVEQDGHLTTGFIGVGLLCPALTAMDRSDLAWRLLLNDAYPSWFFQIRNGATTIWERWDGYTPQKGFQDPAMNSFNHYSLGSVGEWLFACAAGIEAAEPGYRKIRLAPQFSTRLTHLSASQPTPYGTVSAGWRREAGTITYTVTLPPNTTATLVLPGQKDRAIGSGTHRFEVAAATRAN